MRQRRALRVGVCGVLVGVVCAAANVRGDEGVGAVQKVRRGGVVLGSPKGANINDGVLLDHGNQVARFGGNLKQEEKGFAGRSYLDLVELPAREPSMVCQSGEMGSGFPVYGAAFDGDGSVALYSMIDWNRGGHNALALGTLEPGGEGRIKLLETGKDWFMAVAISRDGKRGASYANESKVVELWDLPLARMSGKLDVGVPVGLLAMDSLGERVVVGASKPGEKGVQIWDVGSGKKICDCVGPTGSMVAAAISPDDTMLATADSDGVIWLWELGSGKAWARLECAGERVGKVAFSSDGQRLVASTEEAVSADDVGKRKQRLHLWDVRSAGQLATLETMGLPQSVAFAEDGQSIVTYAGGKVRYWELPTNLPQPKRDEVALAATQPSDGEVARFEYESGWAIAFSADDKRVEVGGTNGFRSWDIGSGKAAGSFSTPLFLQLLNPEQDVGVVGSTEGEHGLVTLVQLSTGKQVGKVDLKGFPYIDAMAVSPDGRSLAMAGGCMKERTSPVFTPRMEVVSLPGGNSLYSVTEHIDSIRCMAFSGDSKTLYVASGWRKEQQLEDGEVHVLDASTGQEKSAIKGLKEVPKAMAVAMEGTRVWVLGEWSVQGFDPATGQETASVDALGQAYSLAVSADGRLVAAGLYDHSIVLIDAARGKVVRRLRRHQDLVMGVAFSADGKRLASVSTDKTVRIWDIGGVLEGR